MSNHAHGRQSLASHLPVQSSQKCAGVAEATIAGREPRLLSGGRQDGNAKEPRDATRGAPSSERATLPAPGSRAEREIAMP